MIKSIIKLLYRIPFFRPYLENYLSVEDKRHAIRHSLKKLSDVHYNVSFMHLKDRLFPLKDISSGGLAFVLENNEQSSIFTPGSMIEGNLNFGNATFIGKFKIAYCRNGIAGCQIMTNKSEFEKFVSQNLSGLLDN